MVRNLEKRFINFLTINGVVGNAMIACIRGTSDDKIRVLMYF